VSSTDFLDFLDESWVVVPKRFKRKRKGLCKVLSRMDSGYEFEGNFSWHEQRGIGYVSKMTMRGNFCSNIFCIPRSNYRKINTEAGEVEVFSFQHKRNSWSKHRRIVVVRWKDENNRSQTNLFDALGYTYAAFVTDLDWDEEDIYRFYDKRADVENHIREAKYDFSINHISTEKFYANSADLELKLLALNQLVLFSKNILRQDSPRPFASTIRRKWLMIPAKLLVGSRQLTLKLSDWFPYRDDWISYRGNLATE
jgi:hypothetical protein